MGGPVESSELASVLDSSGRLLDLYGLKKSAFHRVRRQVDMFDTAPFASFHVCACPCPINIDGKLSYSEWAGHIGSR